MAPPKRIMRDFEIREISAVDIPAQKPALASIIKSAEGGDSDEVDKAKTKTEGGQQFPASDYAYVPDPEKPSTWKLRLTSTPGGDPDPRIVGAAAAALGPGFRGNRVEIPSGDRARVVARVRRAWRQANPDKEPADMPEVLKASEVVKVIADHLEKRWIDPCEGVVTFGQVLAEEMRCRNFHENLEGLYPLIEAMETSVKSIAGASEVGPDQKTSMIRNQVEDFMSLIRAKFSQADEVMMSAAKRGDDTVTMKDQQTLDALKAQVDDLTKKLAAAAAAEKKAEELTEQLKQLQAAQETLKAERDEEALKASMSDEERAYMRGLGKDERAAFVRMSAADRKKAMKKNAEDDETFTAAGRTVRKSVVGEDVFEILKGQAAEQEALKKAAAEERDRRETAEYQKMADDQYGSLPGTNTEKGVALREMSNTLSAEALATLEKMLAAGQDAIAKAFTTIGHKNGQVNTRTTTEKGLNGDRANHPFMKSVRKIQAEEKCSGAEAMKRARLAEPELFNQYRTMNQ